MGFSGFHGFSGIWLRSLHHQAGAETFCSSLTPRSEETRERAMDVGKMQMEVTPLSEAIAWIKNLKKNGFHMFSSKTTCFF